jgi:hypothetical protein
METLEIFNARADNSGRTERFPRIAWGCMSIFYYQVFLGPPSGTDKNSSALLLCDRTINIINGDGIITAQDASLVQQLVAKKITAATEGIVYDAADVNADGMVTAQDASLIQQHVAKKIDISTINN